MLGNFIKNFKWVLAEFWRTLKGIVKKELGKLKKLKEKVGKILWEKRNNYFGSYFSTKICIMLLINLNKHLCVFRLKGPSRLENSCLYECHILAVRSATGLQKHVESIQIFNIVFLTGSEETPICGLAHRRCVADAGTTGEYEWNILVWEFIKARVYTSNWITVIPSLKECQWRSRSCERTTAGRGNWVAELQQPAIHFEHVQNLATSR